MGYGENNYYEEPVNTSAQDTSEDARSPENALLAMDTENFVLIQDTENSAEYFDENQSYEENSNFKNALETVHEEIEVTEYSVLTDVNPYHEADSMGLRGLTDRSMHKGSGNPHHDSID